MRKFGINRNGKSELSKAIRKLDIALSGLIRGQGIHTCTTCGRQTDDFDCGHFRRRECMATRYDYRNVAPQCKKCNRFEGGRPYEFGLAIDKQWGKGTAQKLYKKSQTIKQWTVKELDQLCGAAKHSFLAYKTVYDELMPF